jgi:hypothetical protein
MNTITKKTTVITITLRGKRWEAPYSFQAGVVTVFFNLPNGATVRAKGYAWENPVPIAEELLGQLVQELQGD